MPPLTLIGNIGESLLAANSKVEARQGDVRAVGLVTVKLKERYTALQDPDSLVLQEPQNASTQVKDFIQKSSTASCHKLLQVWIFLSF